MGAQPLRHRCPRPRLSAVQLGPLEAALAQTRHVSKVDRQRRRPVSGNQTNNHAVRERPRKVLVQLAADRPGLVLGREGGGRLAQGVLVDGQYALGLSVSARRQGSGNRQSILPCS